MMRLVWIAVAMVLFGPWSAAAADGIAVSSWVEGRPEQGVATFVVQVRHAVGMDVQVDDPSSDVVEFVEQPGGRPERFGDEVVLTRRFRLKAPAGSYVLPPVSVREIGTLDTDAPRAESDRVFVDLGVPPSPVDGFVEISDPTPVYDWTWQILAIAAAGLVLGSAAALAVWLLRRGLRQPQVKALPPEPPHVLALRRWDAIRSDPTIGDLEKAMALAVLFREYTEAVFTFPATAFTTPQLLARLSEMPYLPEANIGRAQRLLRATDRIKFADESARGSLFEELDDALRAFVADTRPSSWSSGEEP